VRLFLAILLVAIPAFARGPSTTSNNDTCDIGVTPAATLLLPYFEVDFKQPMPKATHTVVTVVNVSPLPRMANVTLWTDMAYPALWFPLFLDPYAMRSVDLFDVFARGAIGGPGAEGAGCADLPKTLSPAQLTDLQQAFTTGNVVPCPVSEGVGDVHANAIGYATIDLVAGCSTANPWSKEHFGELLLYDNVLIGDYVQLDAKSAHGGPLVHIRAIPEGGPAGAVVSTNLPYTFYDRYTVGLPSRTSDRRQPLPSAFAVRHIEDKSKGLSTSLQVWREGVAAGGASCRELGSNRNLDHAEVVRFDEHENATINFWCGIIPECIGPPRTSTALVWPAILLPSASTSGDSVGWVYLNLNNYGSTAYSAATGRDFRIYGATRQSQNWMIATMFAGSANAFDLPAAPLGNGCSPAPLPTTDPRGVIGPARNSTP